uniref:Uncharacterized protein n=1 Tax=viral metagenome TaxID=1070528 RepID=A0A6C0CH62_9ZZZZ
MNTLPYDDYIKIIKNSHDEIFNKLNDEENRIINSKEGDVVKLALYYLRNSDDFDFNNYSYYAEDIVRRFFVYKYKTSSEKPQYYLL